MSSLVEAALAAFFADLERDFAAAAAEQTATTRTLRIAGTTIALRFASPRLADALLPALSARLVPGDRGAPDVEVALWDEGPGGLPVPWRDGHLAAGGLLRGERDGATAVVHELATGAITAIDRPRRRVLHRATATLPWWERAAPLRPALFLALGGRGRHLVHAGAIGDARGGVLLAGPGGSGKTTTALAGLAAGLRYVADDYLLLAGTDAWNVYGTAKLDAGHRARFSALAALTPEPPPGEKAVLDLAAHLPAAVIPRLPVRAVVVPRVTGGAGALRPLAAARALLALAPSTIFQMPFDDGASFATLSALVRGVPCFALDVGDDPAAVAEAIDRVLEAT